MRTPTSRHIQLHIHLIPPCSVDSTRIWRLYTNADVSATFVCRHHAKASEITDKVSATLREWYRLIT